VATFEPNRGGLLRAALSGLAASAVFALSATSLAAPEATRGATAGSATPDPSATPCVCDPQICVPNAGLPDPNAYRHDGFFLRMSLGMGYMWGRGTPDAEQDGYAGAFGISVGSMVAEDFALHFDMHGANAFRSALSIDGTEDKTYNAVFQTTGIGIGATYYLGPSNIYVSAGIGAGWLYTTAYARVDDNYVLTGYESSNFGPAVTVSLGKEWWVHPDWGVGMAGVYEFLSVNGEDLGKYTVDAVHNVTVRLSATFN